MNTRKSKDWTSQIIKDMKSFKINLSMKEIKNIPEEKWKQLVKTKSIENAL